MKGLTRAVDSTTPLQKSPHLEASFSSPFSELFGYNIPYKVPNILLILALHIFFLTIMVWLCGKGEIYSRCCGGGGGGLHALHLQGVMGILASGLYKDTLSRAGHFLFELSPYNNLNKVNTSSTSSDPTIPRSS